MAAGIVVVVVVEAVQEQRTAAACLPWADQTRTWVAEGSSRGRDAVRPRLE